MGDMLRNLSTESIVHTVLSYQIRALSLIGCGTEQNNEVVDLDFNRRPADCSW